MGAAPDFINDLAYFINSINFNFTVLANNPLTGNNTCFPATAGSEINPDATCLSIAGSSANKDLAQVYEICEQLELAIEWIAEQEGVTLQRSFIIFRDGSHPDAVGAQGFVA